MPCARMPALPLRAHNLLCLLGYRGRGYDAAFVAAMTAVHRALHADPEANVLVQATPDVLCRSCPNLATTGCTLGGTPHEAHMRAQDLDVIARLGLLEGRTYPWREILARVAVRLRGADLPGICTTCPWLSLGWCAEGIERVRVGQPPAPPGCAP
jgi:hypothetical protein